MLGSDIAIVGFDRAIGTTYVGGRVGY
jgi:hypothetical protein